MAENTVEINVKGKPVRVPAIEVDGKTVLATGKWIKVAAIKDEDWVEGELENPESYIRCLKEHRSKDFEADVFTFKQRLPNVSPRYSYAIEWDNVAAIRISSYEEWWNKLPSETRRNVKTSAKRGVVVKITEFSDDLVRGIVQINNESPIRQGRPFWHYQKDFDAVKRENGTFPDRSTFIGAYYNDELIGYAKIVSVGEVAGVMAFLVMIKHHDKRVANALIAKAVEHCAEKKISYFTYIKYRYGKKRDSLTEFKRRNGFEEILIPRFFVPLTAKGRIAMALKLHRSLAQILPENLINVLLRLRTKWYERGTGAR